jgi:hypothetical protein
VPETPGNLFRPTTYTAIKLWGLKAPKATG